MKTQTRLKLDTGGAVEELCRLHPDDNPAGKALAERLFVLNDRAGILAQQQRAGTLEVKAIVVEKANIRRAIRLDLEALHRITDAASIAEPEVAVRFALPGKSVNHQAFLATTRAALAQAQASKALLVGYGMPENLLDGIAEGIVQYERAMTGKANARGVHVGASADLDEVADDIMEVVRHLDAINSVRFRDNAELLAAWKSARNVPWPSTREPAPPPPNPDVDSAA